MPDTPADREPGSGEPLEEPLRRGGSLPGRTGEDRSFAARTEPGDTRTQSPQEDAGDPSTGKTADPSQSQEPGQSSQMGQGPGGVDHPLQPGGGTGGAPTRDLKRGGV